MKWYRKILKENKKEVIASTTISILFALAVLLWHFAIGKNFAWTNISPLSTPSLFIRALYSALVFVTLGRILYKLKFYKFLHTLTVGILDDWRLYKDAKKMIWGALMLFMYFWVVPKVVGLLNAIISFFYNILGLILYLLPPLGVSLIVYAIGHILFVLSRRRNSSKVKDL